MVIRVKDKTTNSRQHQTKSIKHIKKKKNAISEIKIPPVSTKNDEEIALEGADGNTHSTHVSRLLLSACCIVLWLREDTIILCNVVIVK